jgi:hypothetical protein
MSPIVAILAALASRAEADWHAGLDLRVDQGAHPVRIGGGVTLGSQDLTVVVDPMYWTDGQQDYDLFSHWKLSHAGWSFLYGWRTTLIGIQGGSQYQQKLLLGVGAPLPFFGELPIRARWSFELASLVVKHGAGLPRQWIAFDEGRDFIDLVNFGMFVTFEYDSSY